MDVGFLGAAQVDRFANLNSTVVGSYAHPRVRLPGAGGAPEIAASAAEVLVMVRHRPQGAGGVGGLRDVGRASGETGAADPPPAGPGPAAVITDLGVLHPDPDTHELVLGAIHPGVALPEVLANTGWDLAVAPNLETSLPPDPDELTTLRSLKERSDEAHRR